MIDTMKYAKWTTIGIALTLLSGCQTTKSWMRQHDRAVLGQNFVVPALVGNQFSTEETSNSQTVYFEFDSDQLQPESKVLLHDFAVRIQDYSSAKVKLLGHTDERGSSDYNLALGWRRAKSVKQFLVKQGIDSKRIDIISLGKERPLSEQHNEAGWRLNRRVNWVVFE